MRFLCKSDTCLTNLRFAYQNDTNQRYPLPLSRKKNDFVSPVIDEVLEPKHLSMKAHKTHKKYEVIFYF